MKKILFFFLLLVTSYSYSQTLINRNKIILQIANGDTSASIIYGDSTLLWSSNQFVFGRNNVTFNKNIYVKGLKTVTAHPVSYKSLFVDASTGKVYSQNTVSSVGNADSLGHKLPSYYRDTFDINYCNGCALNGGWVRNGNTINIDTSYFGLIRAINDSLTNQRTNINALYDTASAHRIILNAHSDSIINLRTETDRLNDSITEHRVVINAVFDSLVEHRTDINNLNDSLILTQRTRDTLTWDATRYWVTSQGYLTTESDPIWTADSSNYYQKVKVDGMLGLKTDTATFNDLLSRFEGDSALVWDSVFNRYTKAQVDYFLSLKADTADNATRTWVGLQGFLKTESDPIWVGDSSNYYKKLAVDHLLSLKADTSININAGYGMLGGGNLQYDRTLSVDTTTLKNVFLSKNTNTRDSIYLKMGSVNSPDGWIVDTLKLRNDYLLTESDPIWTSDSSNYAAKSYVNKMVTDTSYFDGNRTILQSGWTGVTGTNKGTGTVKDFLEAVFFPFVPATISINNTSVLNEVGSVATVYTISGATTVNSETVFSNGGVYKTYPLVDAGLYYNFGAATNYSTTFTFEPMQDSVSGANALNVYFRSQQLVGNNGTPTTIYSSVKYLLSTYPYIYGTDSTAALIIGGAPFYGAMSKLIESVGNKTIGFNTADLKYFWFAYPATYADLTSILDQNGFEQITNFTKYTVDVNSTGLSNDWSGVSYKIYRSNAKAFTVGTWNYQFIY